MQKNRVILFIFFFTILACKQESIMLNSENIKKLDNAIDHEYSVAKYFKNSDGKSIISLDYYSKNDLLIEQIEPESRVQFFYNSKGILLVKKHCRFNNCETKHRELMVYDDKNNLIGSYKTNDSIVNLDNVKIRKTKYYNSKNSLTRELFDTGTSTDGKKWEYWKNYSYLNDKVTKVIETRNNDTIWICNNEYDQKGNLIRIKKVNGEKYENQIFEYDLKNKLIKKIIESNKHSINKSTSFSVKNNFTEFKYDENGRLISEIVYNHKGEKSRELAYKYKNKKH